MSGKTADAWKCCGRHRRSFIVTVRSERHYRRSCSIASYTRAIDLLTALLLLLSGGSIGTNDLDIANISDPENPAVESSAQSTTIHPDHLPATGCNTTLCPANLGDLVLFSAMTPHRTTANTSGRVRWAADLRYAAPSAGNYFPQEASFLAASADETNPALVTDWKDWAEIRRSHGV